MARALLGMAALACLLVLRGQTAADQGERTDNAETILVAQLRGTWVAVSMEHNGQKEEAPKNRELIFAFEATKVTITEGKHTEEWSFQTRDAKMPREIDLIPPKGQAGDITIKGLYQIDGDTLKLAFTRGGDRPTTFDGKGNDGGVITFNRKK